MDVIKRSGRKEPVNLNKITKRLQSLSTGLDVDTTSVALKVIAGLYDGVTTTELDTLAAETCATMSTLNPDYDKLAARIEVSSLHKETDTGFYTKMKDLYSSGLIGKEYLEFVRKYRDVLEDLIDYEKDYGYDFFGIRTLKKSYLLTKEVSGKRVIVERPQDMLMRVASFINMDDVGNIPETYRLLSDRYYTHATPTLFNSGTNRPQLASCFLLDVADDSIEGIYKTLSDCAKISQGAGGIGIAMHKIRAKGSLIKGTGGVSNGLVPMLRVYDATARYVDQGGGKRKGSIAIYLEPWHLDILDFLDLKKNHGKEELRARDLFYALWVNDLFMERVRDNQEWTLFDPKTTKDLIEAHGDLFNRLYNQYEADVQLGKIVQGSYKKLKARDLWDRIVNSQIETGLPYIAYKDAANTKSNQKNLGTIKSSNLCIEIIEYTSPEEIAVCNLASIALPRFIENGVFNYEKLIEVASTITKNLNNVIDKSYYPVPEAKRSNLRHRPIGIGVQGLADVFAILKVPFESEEAKGINRRIFEAIYYGSVKMSIELAQLQGTYETYKGSPADNGLLQFDLWNLDRTSLSLQWSGIFEDLKSYGLRNSLLVALMPTASTSQILGYNEAFEPFTSNCYTRRTLAGEFIVVNKYLVKDLIRLGLWNEQMRQRLIAANGSIKDFLDVPKDIRELYKTVWEISQKTVIDLAADRGPFVCQSQSMNIYMENPNVNKITSMHFHGWQKGLKTGLYYLRTQAARDAIKFTINKELIEAPVTEQLCSLDDPDNCIACSS